MKHEDYCMLLGDKDVRIYQLNVQIAELQAENAKLKAELEAAKVSQEPV